MIKVSSRDVLAVLRRFDVANDDNIPKDVINIKMSHPKPINTLISFKFTGQGHGYYLLFDDTADDDINYVIDQVKTTSSDISGELLTNPLDVSTTYAMPFKGKECYLFQVIPIKKRLDKVLSEKYPEKSRSTWQKHITNGHVRVNGDIITSVKHDVSDDDKVTINLPRTPDYSKKELPILYIDDNVIVIDKPAGILSHSKGELNDEFTVADFFKRYSKYNSKTNRPGIVHRLDRDTSGVMIGARNQSTAVYLQKQFSDRKVKKTYIAVVEGHLKHEKANIDLPIGRNPSDPSSFKVDAGGKTAITKYEVVCTHDKYSMVSLRPLTGRTHQLRVHMKYLGAPILGDKIYGKASDRLYLHAYNLEITIPGGIRKTFESKTPTSFTKLFKKAKL